ncbi:glutathione S-transferase [Pollutimonas harenae]|uniref:Glutathione S-transferase n=1 Tax=Pollutimonas harenae TaxID=657015 RepID=A0A853GPE0_9BURK|nr:glutathione S-transferase [Pollutimonas harenae]NYT84037.1 glutathione S-transferase [Pollutimonas harenae]TEA73538.1 glutathione S-transferase [Pollutimonas harenae]
MRARLAIAVSERQCELREVVLRNKPPSLLTASPKATVPVLLDTDGWVIDQSLDIMLWALRQNDPGQWLVPQKGTLDKMLDLIGECDGPFKQALDRYKYPQRYEQASGAQYRDQAVAWLAGLNQRLEDCDFLFGDRPALADMAIAPFVRQFAHTDLDWFQARPWPHLWQWLQAWMQGSLFEQVMHKYPPWQEGSPGEPFP